MAIGYTDTVSYNGREQKTEGYVLSCNHAVYDEGRVTFSGEDVAKGTDAGTYSMGLSPDMFSYSDRNTIVRFRVIDGWLRILRCQNCKYGREYQTRSGRKQRCDRQL